MGGTFDPIHYGHLVAAEAVRDEFNIDHVLFVPTGKQPFKDASQITDGEHRYLMAVLATAGNPNFTVSRLEIDRKGETYTIDTVSEIRKMCNYGTEIFFITGADAVLQLLAWKDAEELLKMCRFVAVTRPGYSHEKLFEHAVHIRKEYSGKIHFLEIPALSISSTDIRSRVRTEMSVKYLIPDLVSEYIGKNSLYNNKAFSADFTKIKLRVKETLSEKRYIHTLGVVSEALKLADRYGENMEKAYVAAFLHDIAKEMPKSQIVLEATKLGLITDSLQVEQPDLLHGHLGAEVAKSEFSISDEYVLNAIRFHTTGREDMTLLEKIIFLADLIEPSREIFEGLAKIRSLAHSNLDKALYLGLKATIDFVTVCKKPVHPMGVSALQFYFLKTGGSHE